MHAYINMRLQIRVLICLAHMPVYPQTLLQSQSAEDLASGVCSNSRTPRYIKLFSDAHTRTRRARPTSAFEARAVTEATKP